MASTKTDSSQSNRVGNIIQRHLDQLGKAEEDVFYYAYVL